MSRAASEVEAANGALALVGQPAIAALTEPTNAARTVRQNFGDVRDSLLRAHDWNFASAWVVLSLDPRPALGALTRRFRLPDDCLKVRGVKDASTDQWAVEHAAIDPAEDAGAAGMLVTDVTSPSVNYTRRVENVALWDALFLDQFQRRLAARIAPLVTREAGMGERLQAEADRLLRVALRVDGREAARTEVTRTTSWLTARRRGGWRS